MVEQKRSALYWAPRILGIASALFLAMFALDVFAEGYTFGQLLIALFMHLIPSFMILLFLVVAWRWERIGGILFLLLGVFYIWFFWHPSRWLSYLVISGPLFLTGILFLLNNWVTRGKQTVQDQGTDQVV
jgi:hypothetical protein